MWPFRIGSWVYWRAESYKIKWTNEFEFSFFNNKKQIMHTDANYLNIWTFQMRKEKKK